MSVRVEAQAQVLHVAATAQTVRVQASPSTLHVAAVLASGSVITVPDGYAEDGYVDSGYASQIFIV